MNIHQLLLLFFLTHSIQAFAQQRDNKFFINGSLRFLSEKDYSTNQGSDILFQKTSSTISPQLGFRLNESLFLYARVSAYSQSTKRLTRDSLPIISIEENQGKNRNRVYAIGIRKYFKEVKKFVFFLDTDLHYEVSKNFLDEDSLDNNPAEWETSREEYSANLFPGVAWFPFDRLGFTTKFGHIYFYRARRIVPNQPPDYRGAVYLSTRSLQFGLIYNFFN